MFLILFDEFSLLFECFPDGKTCLWIHSLDIRIKVCHGRSLGVVFVGALFNELLIVAHRCILSDVGFVNQTKRTYHAERHFLHRQ